MLSPTPAAQRPSESRRGESRSWADLGEGGALEVRGSSGDSQGAQCTRALGRCERHAPERLGRRGAGCGTSPSKARATDAVVTGLCRGYVVSARGDENLTRFVAESVLKGSTVRTDGWQGYNRLTKMGYQHDPLVLGGDHTKADEHLPMIHLIFSNLKTWLNGTHHGRVETKHLQAYLNQFVFRFNRRFYPMTSFHSVLGIAVRTVPPTGHQLYSGEWQHPTGAAVAHMSQDH